MWAAKPSAGARSDSSRNHAVKYLTLIDGDLAVTTDYRGVLTEVIAARFPEVSTAGGFPGFTGHSPLV